MAARLAHLAHFPTFPSLINPRNDPEILKFPTRPGPIHLPNLTNSTSTLTQDRRKPRKNPRIPPRSSRSSRYSPALPCSALPYPHWRLRLGLPGSMSEITPKVTYWAAGCLPAVWDGRLHTRSYYYIEVGTKQIVTSGAAFAYHQRKVVRRVIWGGTAAVACAAVCMYQVDMAIRNSVLGVIVHTCNSACPDSLTA